MSKKNLGLTGAKAISKEDQKSIQGGGALPPPPNCYRPYIANGDGSAGSECIAPGQPQGVVTFINGRDYCCY